MELVVGSIILSTNPSTESACQDNGMTSDKSVENRASKKDAREDDPV